MNKKALLSAMLIAVCFALQIKLHAQDVHRIPNTVADTLENFIEATDKWSAGDIVMLSDADYTVSGSIDILQSITIMGDPALGKAPVVTFKDNGFHVKDDSINVTIQGIDFIGTSIKEDMTENVASFILRYSGGESMGAYDWIKMEDIYATGFRGALDLNPSKQRRYKSVEINRVYFSKFVGGNEWVLDPNLNLVEDLKITNSTLSEINAVLKNVYFNKDGTDVFGTVPQKILIDHCTFYEIGNNNNALVQLNDQNDGSVDFTFSNNIVSGILNEDNSRVFRLNALAGSYKFENSVFHDFVSSNTDKDQFSLDSVSVDLDNVTLASVTLDASYPEFADTTSVADPKSFLLPSGSSLLSAAKDGGAIGDPRWAQTTHKVFDLEAFIENTALWNAGDTIVLDQPAYEVAGSIDILQSIVIKGDPHMSRRPVVTFKDNGFHVKDDSIDVSIMGVDFIGTTIKEDMSENVAAFIVRYSGGAAEGAYDMVKLQDIYATGFRGGVDLNPSKQRRYKKIEINRVYFSDFTGGNEWVLDPNLNLVEDLKITNSTFSEVNAVLKNVYFNKDGTEIFGTVGQKILIDHCTFYKIGDNNNALVQLNDQNDGSVDFTFSNNITSGILNEDNSRVFRLNALAGSYKFENSVFNDFVSSNSDKDQFSLDSVSVELDNVTLADVTLDADYPGFADTTSAATVKSFLLPSGSPLLTLGKDGGPIGDPSWAGSVKGAGFDLEAFIENTSLWNDGDTIILTEPYYLVNGSIDVNQSITIMGDPSMDKRPVVTFKDNGFNVKDDSINVGILGIDFIGTTIKDEDLSENVASFILRYSGGASMGAYDWVKLEDVYATGFRGGVDLNPSKQRRYKSVVLNRVHFNDFTGGNEWVLDPNLNLVEDLKITNSTFSEVNAVLKNVYFNKDGSDVFGTVGQKILVDHCTFYKIGDNNNGLIQLNDQNDGSIDFVFSNNITSTILNEDNTRSFRLNSLAGTYEFQNSVFHDFVSSNESKDQFSLDSVSVALDNVTLTDVVLNADDPEFEAAEMGNFKLDVTSPALIVDADGGYIGDPRWLPIVPGLSSDRIHPIPNTPDSLEHFLETRDANNVPVYWNAGDTILLVSAGTYVVNGTVDLYQEVTILGDPGLSVRPELRLFDNGFRPKEDSISITLKGFNVNGLKEDGSSNAGYILRFDQAAFQNYDHILIEDVDAYNTVGGIQLYKNKNTLYESVTLNRVYFHDMLGDAVLDPKLNAVKELKITNSTFSRIKSFVKPLYNFTDQSLGLVNQNVTIDHNTFYDVVTDVFIQMNDVRDGSLTFSYTNNIVSKLSEQTNSRPFRIEHNEAGTYSFTNSVFHDFVSSRVPSNVAGYNLDSAAVLSNVTLTDVDTDFGYPGFADTTMMADNFTLPINTPLLAYGSDGGPIGDPRWFPEVGVKINPLSGIVSERDTVDMTATATFGEGTDLTVTWSVLNSQNGTSGEATIDAASGEFVAKTAGDVAVVAVSNFSSVYTDTLIVSIEPYKYVSSINLVAKSALGSEVNFIDRSGGSLIVNATVQPFDAPDKSLTWSIDPPLATFTIANETSIVITGVASGTATVKATANDGSETTGTIDIVLTNQKPVTNITVSSTGDSDEILIGETLQMMATVEPVDADVTDVTWSVDKSNIATIDETGLITAVSAGTVIIKAEAQDNSFKSGTFTLTISAPLSLNPVNDLASIYPNPTVDFINIGVDGDVNIQIFSLTGQKILTKEIANNEKLDIRSLKAGVYVLKVSNSTEVQTINFVKQ
ncbi:MAG: DUF5123 domain-containing protein [Cyclobacteriaceae bacterium]